MEQEIQAVRLRLNAFEKYRPKGIDPKGIHRKD